jgi:Xaa-Pro aminopeptidase
MQQVGPYFSLEKMRGAQTQALQVMQAAAAQLTTGMTEEEAVALLTNMLALAGVDTHWHPPIVRFGRNTSKVYHEKSDPTVSLQATDIFFIDIGPVFDGHEADVGATFVRGDDPVLLRVQQACQQVFTEVAAHWTDTGISGQALYQFAAQRAAAYEMQLNHQIKGHRVGDFPHKLYASGQLGDYTAPLESGIWVLEIQLLDPLTGMGGFVEQVLF